MKRLSCDVSDDLVAMMDSYRLEHKRSYRYIIELALTHYFGTAAKKSKRKQSRQIKGRIPAFKNSDAITSMLKDVSAEVQNSWIDTYKDIAWIELEIQKASSWCKANQNKAPKSNFARFLNSWLSRAFESFRKGLPATRTKAQTIQDNLINMENPYE